MNNNDFRIGRFFWLQMPLSECELNQIMESHRIRPYYIFAKNKNGEYYGFACTSQKPKDISFSNDFLELNTTTIMLKECFKFSGDLLTYENIDESISKLSLSKKDELIKKIKKNYNYKNFPIDVKRIVEDYIDNCEYTNKDILYNVKTNEYIIVIAKNTRYLCVKLSYIPTAGYVESLMDGKKCYLDVLNPFYLDNLDEYVLRCRSTVYEDIFKLKEEEIVYIKDTLDVNKLKNLPLGSVINIVFKGITYVLIKVGQHEKTIDYLVRKKGANGEEYTFKTLYYNLPINYRFRYILGEEKITHAKKRIKK